jgi:hypothetical protein
MRRKNVKGFVLTMIVLLILLSTLVACTDKFKFEVRVGDNTSQIPDEIEWKQINPPPGIEATCWAYFIGEKVGAYQAYGYSGVYCIPKE